MYVFKTVEGETVAVNPDHVVCLKEIKTAGVKYTTVYVSDDSRFLVKEALVNVVLGLRYVRRMDSRSHFHDSKED